MTTIVKASGYRIDFNGSKTYFVTDSADQCRLATPSLRKAKNHLNFILRATNNPTI